MGVGKRQQAIRAMRGQMWSPGRPSTARREDRVRFWEAIAGGVSSEDAAGVAGVSQAVGSRWFRQAGGMPPICLAPVSERYLCFVEREEIAIAHAQGAGVRAIARRLGRSPSTISRELRRNAFDSQLRSAVSGDDRAVARAAACEPPEGLQARQQRHAARLRAGPSRRADRQTRRRAGGGTRCALRRSPPWPPC